MSLISHLIMQYIILSHIIYTLPFVLVVAAPVAKLLVMVALVLA